MNSAPSIRISEAAKLAGSFIGGFCTVMGAAMNFHDPRAYFIATAAGLAAAGLYRAVPQDKKDN